MTQLKEYYEDFYEHLRKSGRDPHTIQTYKLYLEGAVSCIYEKDVENLRLTDVASVIESGKEHGRYGAHEAVMKFRSLLKYLHRKGVELPFDYREIDVPKVPQKDQYVADFDELEAIPTQKIYDLRMRAFCELIFASGLRPGEVKSLNKEDVNWEEDEIFVTNIKTGDEEHAYLTERGKMWLQEYLEEREDNHPALFVSYGDEVSRWKEPKDYLWRHREEWGVPNLTFTSLRRGLATHLIENGADFKAVQHIMRHKSETTTLRHYTRVNKKHVKDTHHRLLNETSKESAQ